MAGSGPWLYGGIHPSAIAHRVLPIVVLMAVFPPPEGCNARTPEAGAPGSATGPPHRDRAAPGAQLACLSRVMEASPVAAEPQRRRRRVALGVIMGLAFLAVAWMAAPLLVGLALGTVMAFTAQPVHTRLSTRFRERRRLAAATTTALGGLMMIGGGAAAVWLVLREVVAAVAAVQHRIESGSAVLVGPRAAKVLLALGLSREEFVARLRDQLGRLANLTAQAAGVVVQTSAAALLTIVVALWTMYYVLVD